MCSLFLFKKHHLLINTFLITAAAGAASPLSAKVTQTKHEIMWRRVRTPPEAKWPVRFLLHEEMMRSIFQINLATGKVETNRWHFKRKRAQKENCQWMINCMQSSLFCWKNQKEKVFSALFSHVVIPKKCSVSLEQQCNLLYFCCIFFVLLSYLWASKKVETSDLFVNGRVVQ